MDCSWTIYSQTGNNIVIEFLDFDLETTHDFIQIGMNITHSSGDYTIKRPAEKNATSKIAFWAWLI